MSKSNAFVIPAGLTLHQEGGAVSIVHEGDIILHGTLGLPIQRVRSTGGNVELHVDATLTEVEAAGHVRIGGNLTVESLTGQRIEAQASLQAQTLSIGDGGAHVHGDLQVETLSASGDVSVGGNLQAQHVSTRGASLQVQGNTTAQTLTISGGNLLAQGDLQVDAASASDGNLSAKGALIARRISAQNVTLSGAHLQVSVVQGAQTITIGAAQIRADILIAPHVQLSPNTHGKITVVEAHNSLTPSAVKGCLSLTDLAEFGLNADAFLKERSLSPLPSATAPAPAPAPVAAEPAPTPVAEASETAVDLVIETEDEEGAIEVPEAPAEAESKEEEENASALASAFLSGLSVDDFMEDPEDTELAPSAEEPGHGGSMDVLDVDLDLGDLGSALDDAADLNAMDDLSELNISFEEEEEEPEPTPASVVIGEEEAVELEMVDDQDGNVSEDGVEQLFDLSMEEQDETGEEDAIYAEMVETVRRIEACYEGTELPPAVTQLNEMVEARNYAGIRDDITNIWNQLLKFHQKRSLRIQPQVTTTFNTINTIVRKI